MKKLLLLLLLVPHCICGMKTIRRSLSQGNSPATTPIVHPRVLAIRADAQEEKKDDDFSMIEIAPSRPRFEYLTHHAIDIIEGPETPEKVKIERLKAHAIEVKAHTEEVKAISKKKIAAMILAGSITSAALTAAVTLTVHFTSCK